MTRPTLILLVAACARASVLPAATRAQEVTLGVLAGINRSTVSWEASPLGTGFEELHRRTAFIGGGSVEAAFTGHWVVRAEFLYVGKGFRETQENGNETRLELAYLELPLLVGWRLASGPVNPELYLGPWVARETSCRLGASAGQTELDLACEDFTEEPILRRTTDWGAAGGARLHLGNTAHPHAVVDVRYTYGLRNVDAAPDIDNLHTHHRGLALTAGFSFPLGS